MYNSTTANVIRNVPKINGSETENLPQYLTQIYARIVSIRRRLNGSKIMSKRLLNDIVELRKLATNLESLTVLTKDNSKRTSAAFVAATANNLLQLTNDKDDLEVVNNLEKESIPSWISSILLFLIGDSPADAAEIAGRINVSFQDSIKTQLAEAIIFIAKGELSLIIAINIIDKQYGENDDDLEAEDYLWRLLLLGLKQMAGQLLGTTDRENNYFQNVIDLSVTEVNFYDLKIKSCYSGPYHLAMMLNILQDHLLSRGVINVDPPKKIDPLDWIPFLQKLASSRPYLWENHFDAVKTGFLNYGNSAVLTFPTGAGKTTIAELKIASTIMSHKSVLYLVPTHALEDQINRDLAILFENLGSEFMEIGGEFTDFDSEGLGKINVMTPERCLTLLAMNPEHFKEIGLIVFDEFHLVNSRVERLDKRSLDAMYCLLRLLGLLPAADYLLISAMVENGNEIASWISNITGRNCEAFTSNWKPTRQLQGCLVYRNEDIKSLKEQILEARKKKLKGGPPAELKRNMSITAHQIFSLRNIWDSNRPNDFFIRKLFNKKVRLELNNFWKLTPNRNQVAAELAAHFIKAGMKTLIFVNNPISAKSTARNLNELLNERVLDLDIFFKSNSRNINRLEKELGQLKYSFFDTGKQVAAHHGLLLPIERQLNEALFKTKDGIHAIVATATLAQGINLPAEVVIIAGDDRFDEDTNYSEHLLAHEILNAAGRAGRAGMAAQGIVILVPGQIITFENKIEAPAAWKSLQKRVFSKSDQCLTIVDPLIQFLDEVTNWQEDQPLSQDLNSLMLRLNKDETEATSIKTIFNNSFAAYKAQQNEDLFFSVKVDELIKRRDTLQKNQNVENWVEEISLKTGINPIVLQLLGTHLDSMNLEELLSFSVQEWIVWYFSWLENNELAVSEIFPDKRAIAQIARALGLKVSNFEFIEVVKRISNIVPIIIAFINGENYEAIDSLIPGKEDDYLTKARHFILRLIPQISFAFGVLSITFRERQIYLGFEQEEFPYNIKNLATLIREGLDTEEKLQYKMSHRRLLRVEIHQIFKDSNNLQ